MSIIFSVGVMVSVSINIMPYSAIRSESRKMDVTKRKDIHVTSEPMAQAIFFWLEAVRNATEGKENQFLSKANFPAVLLLRYGESCSTCLFIYFIFLTGPYISVPFAVYTGIANVQILTPIFPIVSPPQRHQGTNDWGAFYLCSTSVAFRSQKLLLDGRIF